ncbi:MAG TPA: BNR repeat-containing protein [Candidatus Sulfotelmatobacter sp.]|nr:BNR repeat-containing protein [Candidatus Sulfotelmatobacter sp.]
MPGFGVPAATNDVASSNSRAMPVDTLDVAPVWAGHPVGFALLTHAPYQFAAYYDEHRQLTVAQRRLDTRKWQFTRLPDTTGWDSHNSIALTADDDGFLHLCADMHNVPLIYFRTTKPWDAATFARVDKMAGTNELRCTYPQFLRGADNQLLFTYRDGGSGNGNQIYDGYDLKTKTWWRFLDTPLTDGEGHDGEDHNSAYFDGPVRGPDGWFYLAWIWRATGDAATCHDLSFARSRDLKHWETSTGRALSLPMRVGNCEIVDPVPEHGGMVNGNVRLGFDAAGRVTISYTKNDAQGNTQPFIARLEDGHWVMHQVTDWPVPVEIEGWGTLHLDVHVSGVSVGKDGKLTEDYRHFKFGNGTWVLDPTTLRAVGTVDHQSVPSALSKVEGSFPGLKVHWAGGAGSRDQAGLNYALRWETLDANHDRPYTGPLPPPSMLQLITFKTPDATATD